MVKKATKKTSNIIPVPSKMKRTKKYTCTRMKNKNNEKIWVILENNKPFYHIFKTQLSAIKYFKSLKINAEMMVQENEGNNFTKILYTNQLMEHNGLNKASIKIKNSIAEDSDKFFDEEKFKNMNKSKKSYFTNKIVEEQISNEKKSSNEIDIIVKKEDSLNVEKQKVDVLDEPKIEDKIITNKKNILKKNEILLNVKNLNISFKVNRKKYLNIVRGVDLKIFKGQIIGLVGESGSGKTVTSKALMNINDLAITESDEMKINDISLKDLKSKEWSKIRGKKIGYIPQDPLTSLNPTRTIGKQLLDVLKDNNEFSTIKKKKEYLINLLESFGIRDAHEKFNSYPHTFSGGMKQRVVIAMIVAARPELIIADEPTTALDPTVQASVLSLFDEIRKKYNISIIFISHNISVIAKFCDYVYVMYAGKIVEAGSKKDIFTRPAHPYTWALISSIPEDKNEKLFNIAGTPPDMANLPSGDPFAPRNQYAMEIDFKKEPPLFQISKTHFAATWLLDKRSPKIELTSQLKTRLNYFKEVFDEK